MSNGIVGLWHLNETSLGTAPNLGSGVTDFHDSSGNNNHGKLVGSTLFTEGKLGGAVNLNNTGRIDAPSVGLDISNKSFSISFFAKKASNGENSYFISQSNSNCGGSNNCILHIGFMPNNKFRFGFFHNDTDTTLAYTDLNWHHWVVIYDSTTNTQLIYRDAILVGSGVVSSDFLGSGGTFKLGSGFGDELNGSLDEIAVWQRKLELSEVTQLYRRGANRLKIQTRTCADSTCSADEEWQGPDNANGEFYFSELNNCTVRNADGTCDLAAGLIQTINPEYTLSNFTNYVMAPKQYFQYRVLMESGDESATPSLTSIDFGTKYFGGKPTIVTNTGQAFTSLSDFTTTISGTCTPKFQLGLSTTDWYYWNGSNWVNAVDAPADVAEANAEVDISANISQFVADQGSGSLFIRAFLDSDSDQACSLGKIKVTN